MNIGPLSLLVLQPTSFCNIDCSYCYLEHRNIKAVMSDEILTWALSRAFSSTLLGDDLDILWHAGEPLTVGANFYRQASEMIADLNVTPARVCQCIQTNGTLVDPEWCELFKSYNFKVGVSLDGPEWLNDMHRRTRSSRGTFHATMRGLNALRNAGVRFSILAVLTREGLRQIDAVLDFFEAEGLRHIAFNLEEAKGANASRSFQNDDDILELYGNFARRALARQASGRLSIREISAIEQRLRCHPATAIRPVRPLQFVTVDIDGGFSTYCPELHGLRYPDGTRHLFGNVLRNGFLDILANPQFLSLYADIMEGVGMCAAGCDRFSICGGHRVGAKLFENGTFASCATLNCSTRIKAVADVIESVKAGVG